MLSYGGGAYSKHFPLKISPSQIFVMILQAIAINVDKNAEKLRDKFVKHQDKKKLVVIRPSETFIPGLILVLSFTFFV